MRWILDMFVRKKEDLHARLFEYLRPVRKGCALHAKFLFKWTVVANAVNIHLLLYNKFLLFLFVLAVRSSFAYTYFLNKTSIWRVWVIWSVALIALKILNRTPTKIANTRLRWQEREETPFFSRWFFFFLLPANGKFSRKDLW